MQTYALFEDGSASPIVYDFFAPDPKDDPVRLAFPDIEDVQVRNSARNGCLAAYHILADLGHIQASDRFYPSCQFAETRTNINAQGGSAGLAFCLKFVQEVYHNHTGTTLESIAATGEISNGTREASIAPIKSINAKLGAAIDCLEESGWIFYPTGNQEEINAEIHTAAAHKDINLIPVATVEEAIRTYLPASQPKQKKRHWQIVAPILLLLACAIAFVAYPYLQPNTTPLDITIHFHYMSGKKRDSIAIAPPTVQGHPVLHSGDRYKIHCTINQAAYLYIYQMDTAGTLHQLPNPAPTTAPPLFSPNITYQLPSDSDRWFSLDQNQGKETLYFFAAPHRNIELENLYEEFHRVTEIEKQMVRQRLITLMQNANQDGLAFFTHFSFDHIAATSPRTQ